MCISVLCPIVSALPLVKSHSQFRLIIIIIIIIIVINVFGVNDADLTALELYDLA
jgi:hypothetical protein